MIRLVIFLHASIFLNVAALCQSKNTVITLMPNEHLMTSIIQQAIDKCAAAGGGIVHFNKGTFLSGGLELRSNVTLKLSTGTILQGSDNYKDYRNDAFIFGKDLSNIGIEGNGIIDGVDCFNPKGEEKFRGPHCIKLINCKNISLEGITIKNAANWAVNCRYCVKASVKNVSIFGGHDGLHTRFCELFNVTGCDFRTGDDAFAGNDNRDFTITDCKINSSCNGLRMGCYNLTLKDCKFWGPGEYIHKIQKRNNMLAAFVHFSPNNDTSQLMSDNWQIENVSIDQVDHVYMYNFRNGLWQTGKPVGSIEFKNINATGILSAFNIIGDTLDNFSIKITNSNFAFRNGTVYENSTYEGSNIDSPSFVYVKNFNRVLFENVSLSNSGSNATLTANNGNSLILKEVTFNTNYPEPFHFVHVKFAEANGVKFSLIKR